MGAEFAKLKGAILKSAATAAKNCDFTQDPCLVKRELAHLHAIVLSTRSVYPFGLIVRQLVDKYAELPEKFSAKFVKQWRLDVSLNPIWRGRAAQRHVGASAPSLGRIPISDRRGPFCRALPEPGRSGGIFRGDHSSATRAQRRRRSHGAGHEGRRDVAAKRLRLQRFENKTGSRSRIYDVSARLHLEVVYLDSGHATRRTGQAGPRRRRGSVSGLSHQGIFGSGAAHHASQSDDSYQRFRRDGAQRHRDRRQALPRPARISDSKPAA